MIRYDQKKKERAGRTIYNEATENSPIPKRILKCQLASQET